MLVLQYGLEIQQCLKPLLQRLVIRIPRGIRPGSSNQFCEVLI